MTGSTMKKPITQQRTGRTDAHLPPHADLRAQAEPKTTSRSSADTPDYDRTEPHWTEPAASSFASVPNSRGDVSYTSRSEPRKRSTFRFMLMAGIFVIGAGAGLIGAWWLNEPSFMRTEASRETSAEAPVVIVRTLPENRLSGKVRGISPSELPYDGAAPPPDEQEAAPVPAEPVVAKRQVQRVPPLAETNLKPVAKPQASGASFGQNAKADGAGDVVVADAPSPVPGSAGTVEPASTINTDDARPSAGKTAPEADITSPKPPLKAAGQAKEDDDRKTAVTQKRAPPPRSAKDREIERIRQQAEDELKKKSESGRLISRSRGNRSQSAKASRRRETVSPSRTATVSERHVRATLARCERASNIFRREQCKWRICGDAWGKNGCPYYPPHVSNSY